MAQLIINFTKNKHNFYLLSVDNTTEFENKKPYCHENRKWLEAVDHFYEQSPQMIGIMPNNIGALGMLQRLHGHLQ